MKSTEARTKTKKAAASGRPKPRRPLSTYNIFFANERKKIILEWQQEKNGSGDQVSTSNKDKIRRSKQAHVGFVNLARMISTRWKAIDEDYRKELEATSRADYLRYEREMEEWRKQKLEDEEHKQTKAEHDVKIVQMMVKSEQQPLHKTVTRSNEKDSNIVSSDGLPTIQSDRLEAVADDDDADFRKAMVAFEAPIETKMSAPQEQGRNDDFPGCCQPCDTTVYAKDYDSHDSRCYEPYTDIYAETATDVTAINQNVQSYRPYSNASSLENFSSSDVMNGGFYSHPSIASTKSRNDTATASCYSNSESMNRNASKPLFQDWIRALGTNHPNYCEPYSIPAYSEATGNMTTMNQSAPGFQCNSNPSSFASNLNNQSMIDGGYYSTPTNNVTSFQRPYYSTDVAVTAYDYPDVATASTNATMPSFQNSSVASVPFRRRSMPSFTLCEDSKNLTHAATSQLNAIDYSMIRPSGEGFSTGRGFNNYSYAEYSSPEYPTFEEMQRFFGLESEEKYVEEGHPRRKSCMH